MKRKEKRKINRKSTKNTVNPDDGRKTGKGGMQKTRKGSEKERSITSSVSP